MWVWYPVPSVEGCVMLSLCLCSGHRCNRSWSEYLLQLEWSGEVFKHLTVGHFQTWISRMGLSGTCLLVSIYLLYSESPLILHYVNSLLMTYSAATTCIAFSVLLFSPRAGVHRDGDAHVLRWCNWHVSRAQVGPSTVRRRMHEAVWGQAAARPRLEALWREGHC